MKIQLIGTGTIPDIANSASILINDHILFDMPNGNLKAMIRQNIDIIKIDTLIILSTKIVTDEITKDTIKKLNRLIIFWFCKRSRKRIY